MLLLTRTSDVTALPAPHTVVRLSSLPFVHNRFASWIRPWSGSFKFVLASRTGSCEHTLLHRDSRNPASFDLETACILHCHSAMVAEPEAKRARFAWSNISQRAVSADPASGSEAEEAGIDANKVQSCFA